MESKAARKEAIRQYKERKIDRGAFAVRCTVSRNVWVGTSLNLDAAKNSLWFALRLGKSMAKSLQEEWTTHGESAFEYEILEKLADDTHDMTVADLLKARKSHWIAQLGAQPV
jgi:hypothetical protein